MTGVEGLAAAALAAADAGDDDAYIDRLRELQQRGEEAFRLGAAALDDPDPRRRRLGADVLAQLDFHREVDERPWRAPAADLLLDRIADEHDALVLGAYATALGRLEDPRGIPVLHGLRRHPHEEVRYGVVHGLLHQEDDLAIAALVELSGDEDSDVRDWATFGLGHMIDRDDELVRTALAARLDDEDEETRWEAISGLAARGDDRAFAPLLAELEATPWLDRGKLVDEALYLLAARTADPRLRPHVAQAAAWWATEAGDEPRPLHLDDAIAAYPDGLG